MDASTHRHNSPDPGCFLLREGSRGGGGGFVVLFAAAAVVVVVVTM